MVNHCFRLLLALVARREPCVEGACRSLFEGFAAAFDEECGKACILRQLIAFAWAQHAQRGGPAVSHRAVVGDHGNRREFVVYGCAGARVDDVGVALAICFEKVSVVAGGGDRTVAVHWQSELHPAPARFGLLNADPPHRAVVAAAAGAQFAADLHQVVVDAGRLEGRRDAIHPVAFGDGAEVDFAARALLLRSAGGSSRTDSPATDSRQRRCLSQRSGAAHRGCRPCRIPRSRPAAPR